MQVENACFILLQYFFACVIGRGIYGLSRHTKAEEAIRQIIEVVKDADWAGLDTEQ